MIGHRTDAITGHVEEIPPAPLSRDEWDRVVGSLRLSPRQSDIVDLIMRGMRDKQIAAALGKAFRRFGPTCAIFSRGIT